MSKLLTVIIPTFNMEKFLNRCLSSLVVDEKILMDSLDVIIVNDGSKDRSSQIAHRYQSLYPNTFRVIDKENGNYGSCINRGLKEATGKYVKVLDADDRFDNSAFRKYLQSLSKLDVELVLTSGTNIDLNGDITYLWQFPYEAKHYSIEELHHIWIHNVTHRTENLRKINYHQTEGISYSDEELVFYPMFSIQSFFALPIRLYQYTVGRAEQTMNPKIWKKAMNDEIRVSKGILSFLREKEWKELPIASFLREKLVDRFSGFYQRALLQNQMYNDAYLKDFDQYLKCEGLEWYEKLNETVAPSSRWNFHYIKYWRNRNYRLFYYFNKIQLFLAYIQVRNFIKCHN